MKIKITSDSTCDLGREIEGRYGIGIFPLTVILGERSYKDGDVTPQQIFDYVKESGELPKTAAGTAGEYSAFFEENIKGYDELIHINISSRASSCHEEAKKAAADFGGRVRVIDSRALSTGQGLLALKACDFVEEGKTGEEIEALINGMRSKVNTSFVPDALDYLHKGGRCSLAAMLGAKVLKLHPGIMENAEGRLVAKTKYAGDMERCIRNYAAQLQTAYPDYDRRRCFITHSSAEPKLVELAKRLVSEKFDFEEVIETVAGSIVTSHCGKGTLGILFIGQ